MSCNIQFNDNYTIGNSQMIYFEDKLHLPMNPSHINKLEESECTVINIIGYVDQFKQDNDGISTVRIQSTHILPLTVQDLDINKNHVHQTSSAVITNFIDNLISTNNSNKFSHVLFNSLKSIGKIFSEEVYDVNEVKSQTDNFKVDYCDAV